jgi:aryl-alcohol dehydrogenase-like predicted oxidoreductase
VRTVQLGSTGLTASVLGFGCAPMGGRVSERASLYALSFAYERGICLFDTARSYGYGESERILGKFLRGKRDAVVLATKCGIQPTRSSPLKRGLKALARPVLDRVAFVRASLRGVMGRQHSPGHFAPAEVRRSIETSLRELGTDYIDILFLHGLPLALLDEQPLFEVLDGCVQAGLIRTYGVSSGTEVAAAYLARADRARASQAVQYPSHFRISPPLAALAARPEAAALANQPFSGVVALPEFRAAIAGFAATLTAADTLREKLSTPSSELLADVAINCALRGTRTHVVLGSMFKPAHIEANVRAVEHSRFSDQDVQRLRAAIYSP